MHMKLQIDGCHRNTCFLNNKLFHKKAPSSELSEVDLEVYSLKHNLMGPFTGNTTLGTFLIIPRVYLMF